MSADGAPSPCGVLSTTVGAREFGEEGGGGIMKPGTIAKSTVNISHSVRLTLESDGKLGKPCWNSVPVTLVRDARCGDPAGSLATTPRAPLSRRALQKVKGVLTSAPVGFLVVLAAVYGLVTALLYLSPRHVTPLIAAAYRLVGRDPRKDYSRLHGYSYASLEADLAAAKAAASNSSSGGWFGKQALFGTAMQTVRRMLPGGGGRRR